MHIELPDPHPGRCRNLRYVGAECLRCLDYDDTPHICRFPEPAPSITSVSYTIQTTSLSPWVAPTDEFDDELDDEDPRDPNCIAHWPDCVGGGYDPRCCRFPKSCSCDVWTSSA